MHGEGGKLPLREAQLVDKHEEGSFPFRLFAQSFPDHIVKDIVDGEKGMRTAFERVNGREIKERCERIVQGIDHALQEFKKIF